MSVFSNLLLSLLCLHVVLLTHAVKTLLHLLLLGSVFLHHGELGFQSCVTSITDLSGLLLPSLDSEPLLFLGNFLFPRLVFFSLAEGSIVLGLKLSDLLCLLASVLDLPEGSNFFLLEHSDSVAQLLDISLNLKSN